MRVVTAEEMKELEKQAFSKGASEEAFMEAAGKGIAEQLMHILPKETPVCLLCGKGNNGGDAYVVGRHLLQAGYHVVARVIPPTSPLCKKQAQAFKGRIQGHIPNEGVLVDGLLGTGFHGEVEGELANIIEEANASHLKIFAVDIPSGLDGTSGLAKVVIHATTTFFLELPKRGFFFEEGPKCTGKLICVPFGLRANVKGPLQWLTEDEIAPLIPPILPTRHKYQTGYVIGLSGSHGMPGAAILASTAALRGGAGIMRLFLPEGLEEEISLLPPEVLRFFYTPDSLPKMLEEMKRANALFFGPGIGQAENTKTLLKSLLKAATVPCVIDADALNICAQDETIHLPKEAIITPHVGEMKRLLQGVDPSSENVLAFAKKHEVIIVLKGAPTFIFSPRGEVFICSRGDPGMATAGTGDVLTGLIAALLAQKVPPLQAACLGVYVHGLAGEAAAIEKTSYSLIASDLIASFADVFRHLTQFSLPL